MQRQSRIDCGTFVAGLLALLLTISSPAFGQRSDSWARPQQLPGYEGLNGSSSTIYPPLMVVDQNRTVHAFNSLWYGDFLDIAYSRWTKDAGWTIPNDIVMSPREQARIMGVVLDQEGILHVIFWGGNDLGAEIYYTYAPATLANSARSWSPPVEIGSKAITPSYAVLSGDGQGTLVGVYSGDIQGRGLYSVTSLDGGLTWSEPEIVYLTYSEMLWPSALAIELGEQGQYHLVWANANVEGNGEVVYYARRDSGLAQWSRPLKLVQAIDFEADTPAIIEHEGVLILIYHNDFPTTRWMVTSQDGGNTWSEPIRLFEQVGSNGPASLVEDGSGTLHMFFGNRITGQDGSDIHGMWHSNWLGDGWSVPEAVISGPLVRAEPSSNGFDPSFARAVVVQGNTFLVAWNTDPAAGPNGIWSSFVELNIPESPLATLSAPLAPLSLTPTLPSQDVMPDSVEEGSLNESPLLAGVEDHGKTSQVNPTSVITGSSALVFLVIILPIFVKLVLKGRTR